MSFFSSASYIFGVLVAAWCSLHFFMMMYSYSFLKKRIISVWWHRIAWACCMTFFVYWLVHYCFWPLGCCEGYWCFHPFVVLMQHQATVFFSTVCGLWPATFYYFLFCSCLGELYSDVHVKKWTIVMATVFCGGGFIKNTTTECPLYLKNYVVLQTHFQPSRDPYVWTNKVQKRMRCLQDAYGSLCFLAPESWFPYMISEYPLLLNLLIDALEPSSFCIAGSYFMKNNACYNALYAFSDTTWEIVLIKRHGVFFIERIPWFFTWLFNAHAFKQGAFTFNKQYHVIQEGAYYALCSEFHMTNFFETKSDAIWIVLVNDGWFKSTMVPLLLRNAAFLRSWLSGIPLLYISYDYAEFFQQGFCWPLQKSMII